VKWWCQCSCGSEPIEVVGSSLVNGHTKSCGCYNRERLVESHTIHGEADKTPEYSAWQRMRNRCLNKKSKRYKDYGERGIKICDRWLESFENFLEDMGRRPTKDHSLDRIDNNSNYGPNNCKWSTRTEQNRNRRNTQRLTYKGETKTIAEWSEEFGIKYDTLHGRIEKGWSVKDALEIPVGTKRIYT